MITPDRAEGVRLVTDRASHDYVVHGRPTDTVVVVWPVTEAAVSFFAEHVDPDAPRWGTGFAVDHRYVEPLLAGMAEEGLVGRVAS